MIGPEFIDDVPAFARKVHECFEQKEFATALDGYAVLCRLRPGDAFFADREAYCLVALARWPQARERWIDVIESHGIGTARLNYLVQCSIEMRDYAAAVVALGAPPAGAALDATSFVFKTIASLGAGDVEAASVSAMHLLRSVNAGKAIAATDHLAWRLRRLVKEDHGDAVLRFLDRLIACVTQEMWMLTVGIEGATYLRRYDSKLTYASHMIRLAPHSTDGYVHKMHALLDAELFDECEQALGEMNARFPWTGRTQKDDEKIGSVGMRLPSWRAWNRVLQLCDEGANFQSMNQRVAAHFTLQHYEKAIELGRSALKTFDSHPRFLLLLGKCHEAIGQIDTALSWYERADRREPNSLTCLILMYEIKLKLGQHESARHTLDILLRRYPTMPIVRALSAKLGRFEAARLNDDVQGDGGVQARVVRHDATWLHGGDSGDLIYALAAMRSRGGGDLYLTCFEGTREPMDNAKMEFLEPLLWAQSSIRYRGAWNGEPVEYDFNVFRHRMFPSIDLATQQWQAVLDETNPDVKTRWLTVPACPRHGRPVFARSQRYRNKNWEPLWKELKASCPDAIFVGTCAEFAEFGHGEHCLAKDGLELARIIGGASIFVGNQSLPYAMAEGLKVGRVLEVCTYAQNCNFPGALALDLCQAAVPA